MALLNKLRKEADGKTYEEFKSYIDALLDEMRDAAEVEDNDDE